MLNFTVKKNLAQIILYESRELILIIALLLTMVYKHFQPGEFVSCSRTLENALKVCNFDKFSLGELIYSISKAQYAISKVLIAIAACGWLFYFLGLLLLMGLRRIYDKLPSLMIGIIKITIFSSNLFLIYNLLIVLFGNGAFPRFQPVWWNVMFWWTFGCYIIPFLFYVFENRKGLTDGSRKNVETRSYPNID